MKLKDTYDVGIYCRLSRDDNNGSSESMSISNQKQMLTEYVISKGWQIKEIFIDDGYSGTNFERPAFNRMLGEIENGNINLVITKDLSRLGRDYVRTGYYTDIIFPQYRVRYIAVNDSYDSANRNNEIAPFRNVLNEMYAGDISKKVRSQKKSSAKQGHFLGSLPPYGYLKSSTDKHKLIIDEKVVHIVKRIFNMYAAGHSARNIANVLNSEGIPCPSEYHYRQVRGENNPHGEKLWGSASISLILKNQVHIGNMAQCKHTMISFKSKQREYNSQDEWIVVEGTHEASVDKDVWNTVQKRIIAEKRTKVTKQGEISLFSGLLRCADCGAAMSFTTRTQSGKTYLNYRCRSYANNGKSACSIHSTPIDTLSEMVLDDIKQYAVLATKDMEALTKVLAVRCNKSKEKEMTEATTNAEAVKNRIKSIDVKVQTLFEEKCEGNIPANIFKKLMTDYENEKIDLTKKATALKSVITDLQNDFNNISNWISTVKKYVKVKELDRDIVTDLIDRIEVSEAMKVGDTVQRNISIYYKFVGCLTQEKSEPPQFACS